MKKFNKLALLLAALLFLAACKRSGVEHIGIALDEWRGPQHSTPPPKEVEVEVYTDADFSKDIGIDVTSLPNPEKITANKFFAIDEWYGQIEFTTSDNLSLNVRVASAEEKRLATTYSEPHVHSKVLYTIDGIEVSVALGPEGCALASWVRGTVQFSVHSNKKQGAPPMQHLEEMVKSLRAELL